MTISLSCAALLYALLSAQPTSGSLYWVTFTRAGYAKLIGECSGFVDNMEKKGEN